MHYVFPNSTHPSNPHLIQSAIVNPTNRNRYTNAMIMSYAKTVCVKTTVTNVVITALVGGADIVAGGELTGDASSGGEDVVAAGETSDTRGSKVSGS